MMTPITVIGALSETNNHVHRYENHLGNVFSTLIISPLNPA